MKITPKVLRQLIKEEYYSRILETKDEYYSRLLREAEAEAAPTGPTSAFKQDIKSSSGAKAGEQTKKAIDQMGTAGAALEKIKDPTAAAAFLQDMVDEMSNLPKEALSQVLTKLKSSMGV